MKRLLLIMLIGLPVILTACAGKTELRFANETSCGTATITLTNVKTGNIKDYTVAEGKEIGIEMDPEIEYNYEVTYPRQPDFMVCDTKKVTVALDDGQTLTVRLTSVLDQSLIDATATAEAESTSGE